MCYVSYRFVEAFSQVSSIGDGQIVPTHLLGDRASNGVKVAIESVKLSYGHRCILLDSYSVTAWQRSVIANDLVE
ncbi:MAG: hypothetical protein JWN13_2899 [Betaproteobacteria bacterium]|nr:hypothetical protein [Betaproteobacteria bacterium]